jgi:hypothetical protein
VDQDFELQVYLPDEPVPDAQESDLAAEEPSGGGEEPEGGTPLQGESTRANGRTDGRSSRQGDAVEAEEPPAEQQGFDLAEDLTPYEFGTITRSVDGLRQPASYVEIFGSIRDLDERGELELSQEEIREVIGAMLDTGFLKKERAKPYEAAKARGTFYVLDKDREEIKAALERS